MIRIGSITDVRGTGLPINRIEAPSEAMFKWLTATIRRDYNPSVFIAIDLVLVTGGELPQSFMESLKIKGFIVNEPKKNWFERFIRYFRS